MNQIILNSKGEPIVLNAMEQRIADLNQRQYNALGFEIPVTTLTAIQKKISEQKFYEIPFADYVPVRVGQGAYSSNLLTYRSYALADDFATGVINLAGNNGRLASADAGVDSVIVKIINWGKSIGWTHFELQEAAKSGNWDVVTAKEKSRKKNWDLGLQKIAFLGMSGDPSVLGILTQAGVTADTTTLTAAISSLSSANLSIFAAAILNVYRINCGRTAWPSIFGIPESDYLGLATPTSDTFPIKSKLALLQETLQVMTGNPQFKILPCAYGDAAQSGLGVQKYFLTNYEEESIRMDIPVDYTNTLANSLDNFSYQNVGYGQFTGVVAYRPQELYYFQF